MTLLHNLAVQKNLVAIENAFGLNKNSSMYASFEIYDYLLVI